MSRKNRLSQENGEFSPTGMISQDVGTLLKLRKKRIMKIVAIVVSIAIVLAAIGGTVAGLLTINNEGSIFYNIFKRGSLSVPKNLRIEDYDEETSFSFLVRWDEIKNATSYTLECVYELYPDKVDTYEIFAKDGRYIERKRGKFTYRVKANNLSGSGEFSEWKEFDIPPMKLALPEITLVQQGSNVVVSWSEVEYRYFNHYGTVYYEFIEGGYWNDEEFPDAWTNQPMFTYGRDDRVYTFENIVRICDVFTIKIRPINYRFMLVVNQTTGMPERIKLHDPVELYDIYEVSEQWAEKEIELDK